ncbi:MAG: FAD-dependent oxidoreductase [Bacteroidota bacterium]
MALKVSIIGGGVIGLFCAYYLQKAGASVEVFDRGEMSDGCSHGNAGMIVPSHFIPLAAPGMMAKGIRWMFNPESPFYVRPRLSRSLLSWGWQFYKAATKQRVAEAAPVLRDISLLSKQLYQELAREAAFDFAFEEKGLMMLYKTAKAAEEEQEVAHMANRLGIEAQVLSAETVKAMEPEVALEVSGAVYYPGDAHLHPNYLLQALRKKLQAAGVTFHAQTEIQHLERQGKRLLAICSHRGKHEVEEVVIAGGAWTPQLVRQLGCSLPLQAGKGYSFTVASPAQRLKYPSILTEAKIAVTPMGSQLRFAGTMEIGGLDESVNPRRLRGIVKSIPHYFPDFPLRTPKREAVWSGLRPCSPDGKPYIGRLASFGNVSIAGGHAMMGLSLAPATGLLVAQLLEGKARAMPLQAFSPNRFA